jgi:hypothetical protein
MTSDNLSFNQINEQFANGQSATVLVEREDHTIVPGQVILQGENNTRVFLSGTNARAGDAPIPTKRVSTEKLSDSHQEILAEKLAGLALRGEE